MSTARDQFGDVLQIQTEVLGMEPSDAKRLRALEYENGKLKKLLAEQMLDNAMLRDINTKNGDACWEAVSGFSSVQSARCESAAGV